MHEIDRAIEASDDYGHGETQPPSIYRLVRALAAYRTAIATGLLAVSLGYLLVAAVLVLRAPSQRVFTLPFRLEFSGAGLGQYPNGLKFNAGDIVAAPVATAAYRRNQLDRFVALNNFLSSLVVLASNPALEQLTAEYRTRLGDARLSPVDRERLTQEFQQRSASLNKDQWALSLVVPDGTGTIPPTVAKKTLQDVLNLWAEDAATTRKVLQHRIPTLTTAVFGEESAQGELVISLMRLRARVSDVMANLTELSTFPGAELARTQGTNMTLAEIHLTLSDLLRTEVEPLIARAIQARTIVDHEVTMGILRAQLEYDRRQRDEARRRAEILRGALIDYRGEQPPSLTRGTMIAGPREDARREQDRDGGESLVLNDSFLDRLVKMTNAGADREYRQALVNEIRVASLQTLPLETKVTFDEQVIEQAQRASAGRPEPAARAALQASYDASRRRAIQAVNEVNEIHELLSRNLQPPAQLFALAGPVTVRVERSISLVRLALGGLITLAVALALLVIAALAHHRFLREEKEDHDHESATS